MKLTKKQQERYDRLSRFYPHGTHRQLIAEVATPGQRFYHFMKQLCIAVSVFTVFGTALFLFLLLAP